LPESLVMVVGSKRLRFSCLFCYFRSRTLRFRYIL